MNWRERLREFFASQANASRAMALAMGLLFLAEVALIVALVRRYILKGLP